MAARPEVFTRHPGAPPVSPDSELRPAALVLPLRRTDSQGRKLVDQTSGDRLGPAQGLVIGLVLSAAFWLAIVALAWAATRH